MAQKLRKHGKKLEKTSVGCDIDFTILLSMLKVKVTTRERKFMSNSLCLNDIICNRKLEPFRTDLPFTWYFMDSSIF